VKGGGGGVTVKFSNKTTTGGGGLLMKMQAIKSIKEISWRWQQKKCGKFS